MVIHYLLNIKMIKEIHLQYQSTKINYSICQLLNT